MQPITLGSYTQNSLNNIKLAGWYQVKYNKVKPKFKCKQITTSQSSPCSAVVLGCPCLSFLRGCPASEPLQKSTQCRYSKYWVQFIKSCTVFQNRTQTYSLHCSFKLSQPFLPECLSALWSSFQSSNTSKCFCLVLCWANFLLPENLSSLGLQSLLLLISLGAVLIPISFPKLAAYC